MIKYLLLTPGPPVRHTLTIGQPGGVVSCVEKSKKEEGKRTTKAALRLTIVNAVA